MTEHVSAPAALDQSDVEPLVVNVLADVGVLTGADTVILVESGDGVRRGRVIVSGSQGAVEAPGVDGANGFAVSGADHREGRLEVSVGAALAALRTRLPMLPGEVRTVVSVPLRAGGVDLGVAVLGFNDLRRPREQSRRIFTAAASQLGLALQQQRLTDSLRDQAEESRILLELARLSTSTLDLHDMLDRFLTRAVALTSADKGSIWLLAEDRVTLIPTALAGMPPDFVATWKQQVFRLDEQPLAAEVVRTRRAIAIPDAAADPRADQAALQLFGERALLIVPITVAGTPHGALFLNNETRRERHTERELDIAQSIAAQAGAAIELARLFAASEAGRRDLQAAFRQFGEVLSAGTDRQASLSALGELALHMTRADFGTVYLLNDGQVQATAGVGRPLPNGSPYAFPTAVVQRAIDALETIHVPAAPGPSSAGPPSGSSPATDRSFLVTPLPIGEAPVGALAIARATAFDPDEIDLLASFGRGTAVAVQRSEILDALERRVVELSSLQRVSQTMMSLSNLSETLENVVRAAQTLTSARRSVLLLVDPDTGRLGPQGPAVGLSAAALTALSRAAGPDSAAQRALDSEEPYVVNGAGAAGDDQPADVTVLRDRNVLMCPMRAGDAPLGVIRVSNRPHAFSADDVRLLSIFAGQAAVVIRNVMLFQEETREREQLQAIFVGASDAIVIVDDEAHVLRMNPAAEHLTGWTQSEALGRPAGDILRLRDADGRPLDTTHPLRSVQLERSTIAYSEQTIAARDDRLVEIVASYAYVPGHEGEGGLGLAIIRDLSAAKQVERLKSDFVSFVSHELRTPLSLIKGYASTLLRPQIELADDIEHRFMQGISDAADRLALIVNNLLNASRIESGLYLPRLQDVHLRALVTAVIDEMSEAAVGRLSLVWEAGDVMIRADPDQLRLVISNIIGNAVRYAAPHGDGPIVILGRATDGGVSVEVTDGGPGIDPEDLPRVFEKFYRGAGSERASVPGSGLGLYICRSLIEAHDGRIWATSTPGAGATVGFWLPAAATPSDDAAPESPDA